jgi:hypothetical protein
VISIQVKSGYDGSTYHLDTDDREMAAKWLLGMAIASHSRMYGPNQGGIYAPMTIERCSERSRA